MDYQEATDFLFPLHRFGIRPGLERLRLLLDQQGAPEKRLGRVVHIAGTNGKGTLAAALASIFQVSGKKTALYTSPHLVDFTERIRIDGKQIPRSRVALYCDILMEAVKREKATFFEATTVMAFSWFADEGVDVSVIETGMGGRLDATNVVRGDIVLIPSIGLDHTAWLGESLRAIASEKAAIIKPGARVYTAVSDPDALDEIQQAADRCGAPLFLAGRDASWRVQSARPGMLDMDAVLPHESHCRLQVPVTGAFHAPVITLAVMAARAEGIDGADIAAGLASLVSVGYRARLEKIASRPDVMLDVSHNPDGMEKTVAALREMCAAFRSLIVVVGIADDKDASGIVRPLAAFAGVIVTVNIPSGRAFPSRRLRDICLQEGAGDVRACDTVQEGVDLACALAGPDDMILVTGSFYLAGEVIATNRWPADA